jgi:prepilin-type N-terminal cleavage/methylation domain-containing protein
MRVRGFTLVELMITVALLGILTLLFDAVGHHVERVGLAEVQRERARLLVEYHARQLAAGAPIVPVLDETLRAQVPGLEVRHAREGKLVTVSATWPAPTGPAGRLSLTVFAGGGR